MNESDDVLIDENEFKLFGHFEKLKHTNITYLKLDFNHNIKKSD